MLDKTLHVCGSLGFLALFCKYNLTTTPFDRLFTFQPELTCCSVPCEPLSCFSGGSWEAAQTQLFLKNIYCYEYLVQLRNPFFSYQCISLHQPQLKAHAL